MSIAWMRACARRAKIVLRRSMPGRIKSAG
jgi:hypothetical protein